MSYKLNHTGEEIDVILNNADRIAAANGIVKVDASGNASKAIPDTDYATPSYVGDLIAGKVDKVTGKGLSTNDYTTDEKNKLSGIEAGANKTTDAHINSLIDAKLGVIENGSY